MNAANGTARDRSLRLAALPTAPGVARAFVAGAVRAWRLPGECAQTAELLVSELVTNAVKQTGRVEGSPTPGPTEYVAIVRVRVRLVRDVVRIEVWDNDQTRPEPAEQSPDAESGRGLFLVEALSQRWGVFTSSVSGKVVWCEVATVQTTTPTQQTPEPLPKRQRKTPSPVTMHSARYAVVDVALLERVVWGLRQLQI